MPELYRYCRQDSNAPDVRQARMFQSYLIATLLGGDTDDVRFYDSNGICYRHASFR